jgi:toxin ParE1/3/4
MYAYYLSFEAEIDIERIYEYGFYKFGILQADLYYDKLFECFKKIATNPLMFPAANHFKKGYRTCICGVDTIYFSIKDESTVEIITIIGRQDYS